MLHTPLCDLLGIEHPIVSAPMAGTATADLVAAVSAAGGFGLLGGTSLGGPEWLREQIRAVREQTDRPFGVGFISSAPGTADLMAVALEERVAAVSHSFADPTPWIEPAHRAGVKVLVQVQTVAQAVTAARAGADAIAAQGVEAGGHAGTTSATLPLIPAVVDAVGTIPVLAAGGIADGRGLAAALMLGAAGVWMGTRFVASNEWAGGEWAKARVVAASTDDAVQTRVYDLITGAPFPEWTADRVIRNPFVDAWQPREDEIPTHAAALRKQIEAAQSDGDTEVAAVRAGNVAGLIHTVEPAGEIVRRVAAEAERLLRERPAQILR